MALAAGAVLALKSPPNERPLLGSSIAAAAASGGDGGSLDLAAVADFPWDHVHVFGPYLSHEDVEQGLGFAWTPMAPGVHAVVGDLFLLPSDELALLVFVKGEREVTGWTILNRDDFPGQPYVNFESADSGPSVFAHGDAVFVVDEVSPTPGYPVHDGWLLTR